MGWNLETNLKGPTNRLVVAGRESRSPYPQAGSRPPGSDTAYYSTNWNKPTGATLAHITANPAGMTDVAWTYVHWTLVVWGDGVGYTNLGQHALHSDGDMYASHNAFLSGWMDCSTSTVLHVAVNYYIEGGWLAMKPAFMSINWFKPAV